MSWQLSIVEFKFDLHVKLFSRINTHSVSNNVHEQICCICLSTALNLLKLFASHRIMFVCSLNSCFLRLSKSSDGLRKQLTHPAFSILKFIEEEKQN